MTTPTDMPSSSTFAATIKQRKMDSIAQKAGIDNQIPTTLTINQPAKNFMTLLPRSKESGAKHDKMARESGVTSRYVDQPEAPWNFEITSLIDKGRTSRNMKQSSLKDYSDDIFWKEVSVDNLNFDPDNRANFFYMAEGDKEIGGSQQFGYSENSYRLNDAEDKTCQYRQTGSKRRDSNRTVDRMFDNSSELQNGRKKSLSLSHPYSSWSADSTDGPYRVVVENQNGSDTHGDTAWQGCNNYDNIHDSRAYRTAADFGSNESSIFPSNTVADILNSLKSDTLYSAGAESRSHLSATEGGYRPARETRKDVRHAAEETLSKSNKGNLHVVDVRFLNAWNSEDRSCALADISLSASPLCRSFSRPLPAADNFPRIRYQHQHQIARMRGKKGDDAATSRNRNQVAEDSLERVSSPGGKKSGDERNNHCFSHLLLDESRCDESLTLSEGRRSIGSKDCAADEAASFCRNNEAFPSPVKNIQGLGGVGVGVGAVTRKNRASAVHWKRYEGLEHWKNIGRPRTVSKSKSESALEVSDFCSAIGAMRVEESERIEGDTVQAITIIEDGYRKLTDIGTNLQIIDIVHNIAEIKIEDNGITDICEISCNDDSTVDEGEGEREGEGEGDTVSCLGSASSPRGSIRTSSSNEESNSRSSESRTHGLRTLIRNAHGAEIESLRAVVALNDPSSGQNSFSAAQSVPDNATQNVTPNSIERALEEGLRIFGCPTSTQHSTATQHCAGVVQDVSTAEPSSTGGDSSPLHAVKLPDLDLGLRSPTVSPTSPSEGFNPIPLPHLLLSISRSSDFPSTYIVEPVSTDPSRWMRAPLGSAPSSSQQGTLDPSSFPSDMDVGGFFYSSHSEGGMKGRIGNMTNNSGVGVDVDSEFPVERKAVVQLCKATTRRKRITNSAHCAATTIPEPEPPLQPQPQPQLQYQHQSEIDFKLETVRKTFFTDFRFENQRKNGNLLEYFRVPIPSRLHLRSNISAKSKKMSPARLDSAGRVSKAREHYHSMSSLNTDTQSNARTAINPVPNFPLSRHRTLTSRPSRPHFLAPKYPELADPKSALRNAISVTVSNISPLRVKAMTSKTAAFPLDKNNFELGYSHENMFDRRNAIITDSSDSLV